MMRNRLSFASVVALIGVLEADASARAEDAFTSGSRTGPVVTCARDVDGERCSSFQGYIYVHRYGAGAERLPAADAANTAERFYLHEGAAANP